MNEEVAESGRLSRVLLADLAAAAQTGTHDARDRAYQGAESGLEHQITDANPK